MFRPLSIFIGTRYTRAKRRNHFISFISMTSMIGLALGVLAMIVVLSVMNGFQQEMSSRILGMVPHAVIDGVKPLDDWKPAADAAMKNPQVTAAVPFTQMDGMLSYKGSMQPIEINGVDPALESKVSIVTQHIVQGRLQDLKPGEFGVVIGEITARRFRLNVGDKITLIVPEISNAPGGITPRLQRLTVVGVFKVGAELDGSMALVNVADAAVIQRWQPNQVQGVRLALTDLYAAPQVSTAIAGGLGADYKADDWTHTQGSLFSAMKMEKTMIGLLLLMIVAVAAFNIIDPAHHWRHASADHDHLHGAGHGDRSGGYHHRWGSGCDRGDQRQPVGGLGRARHRPAHLHVRCLLHQQPAVAPGRQ
jgi:lipoprotein-releasing system permease protein